MNSRKLLLGCGIVLVLGLGVVVVGGIIASFLIPNVDQQLPPGAVSILVNINLPLNGAQLPLNEPVSIYAEAVSEQPVHDLELWVDGVLNPAKTGSSPADNSPLSAVWSWTPNEEGINRLLVRAIGAVGEVANSNVVRVSVLPREDIASLKGEPIPGDLLPPVGDPAEIAALDNLQGTPQPPPSPPPSMPSPPPPQVPAQPPGNPPQPGWPPIEYIIWWQKIIGNLIQITPPTAPALQGAPNKCDGALLIQDNADDETGFFIYRFDPNSTGFKRIATLDKYPGKGAFAYIDPGLSLGNHLYYIASFNGAGESPSNLINLKVTDPQCAAGNPQVIGLQDAKLKTTKAVDKVYCYLSVDQGPWNRIPPGQNTFITPTGGEFDLGKYLNTLISPPPPGGVTLELECWGWSGNTLVYLGYIKKSFGTGPIQWIGQDFELIGNSVIQQMIEGMLGPPPQMNIAPPANLIFAKDYKDCMEHAAKDFVSQILSGAICKSAMKNGYTVLTWFWWSTIGCWPGDPNCPYNVTKIDGYHVYKLSPGNQPVLIDTLTNPDQKMSAIPPQQGLFIQPQYYVRAYQNILESADSAHINGIQPKYTKTVTLTNPSMSIATGRQVSYDGFACPDDYGPEFHSYPSPGSIIVGYNYYVAQGGQCTNWVRYYNDGYVVFDLSQIKGSVDNAKLRWKWEGTFAAGGGVQNMYYGCYISLSDGNSKLYNYTLFPGDDYDVTTLARAWMQGLPNSGFVFLSGSNTLEKAANEQCQEKYGDFELEVTYTTGSP